MAIGSFTEHDHGFEGVNAAFLRNHRGDVCIAFADPAYVRAEKILIDNERQSIHAILHESLYFLGEVSETMMGAFEIRQEALLTSLRTDGTIYETMVPVEIRHGIIGEQDYMGVA